MTDTALDRMWNKTSDYTYDKVECEDYMIVCTQKCDKCLNITFIITNNTLYRMRTKHWTAWDCIVCILVDKWQTDGTILGNSLEKGDETVQVIVFQNLQ